MMKQLLILTALISCFASASFAKDKSMANDYKVILKVANNGKVTDVKTEAEMPECLKERALNAFIDKKVGKRVINGQAVPYQQKLVISSKFLMRQQLVSSK